MGGLPAFVGRLRDETVFELRISRRQQTRHPIKGGDWKAILNPGDQGHSRLRCSLLCRQAKHARDLAKSQHALSPNFT
jgi:hypothetical protein